jgi:short subunit dehydrogenase-like uncharacterized protein
MSRYDIVLYGATGFAGKLVAEYVVERYGEELSLAVGGRNPDKLEKVCAELETLGPTPGIVVADSLDRQSLDAMTADARVVCSTVGPYAKYGDELVASCVENGAHYCDLTGEGHWIRRMIDRHHAEAVASGTRIVHCCGFDSIPSDLGTYFLQQKALERFGAYARRVANYVWWASGGASGGTIASMANTMEEASHDRDVRRALVHPYALNPEDEQSGPDERAQMGVEKDPAVGWTAPFFMAPINSPVVRRSHALLGFPWGRDFGYRECMRFGEGLAALAKAVGFSAGLGVAMGAMSFRPTRRLLLNTVLPEPGEGPSEEAIENGGFEMRLRGEFSDGGDIWVRVRGHRDPGYGATAHMLGESAVCLAVDALESSGGVLTPASAMGMSLVDRLNDADITFEVIDGA